MCVRLTHCETVCQAWLWHKSNISSTQNSGNSIYSTNYANELKLKCQIVFVTSSQIQNVYLKIFRKASFQQTVVVGLQQGISNAVHHCNIPKLVSSMISLAELSQVPNLLYPKYCYMYHKCIFTGTTTSTSMLLPQINCRLYQDSETCLSTERFAATNMHRQIGVCLLMCRTYFGISY